MNIIIVIDSASIRGGAEGVALSSAVGLARRGVSVTLFAAVSPIDKRLPEAGVKVICLNQNDILHEPDRWKAIRQGLMNTKARKEFKDLLDRYSPKDTIVHFHGWTKALSSSLFAVTARFGFKVVITSHEYFTVCPNGGFFNYPRRHICELKPMSAKCVMCNCDVRSYPQKVWRVIRQALQNRQIRKNRLYMIFISKLTHDVLYPQLKPILKKSYMLRNPIELNRKEPVRIMDNDTYLFIGRLSPEKGAELFCKAMTDLGLKGCVLGDGYLLPELKERYPKVQFAGWVTGQEKEELIRKGKALVFPSLWYEGAPLTIMEMKSYGMPCIVPDRCAASEEITDGGTGFVFKTGDLESLEDSIMKYERTDISRLQENLLDSFRAEDYSMEHHLDGLLGIYNDVLKSNQ